MRKRTKILVVAGAAAAISGAAIGLRYFATQVSDATIMGGGTYPQDTADKAVQDLLHAIRKKGWSSEFYWVDEPQGTFNDLALQVPLGVCRAKIRRTSTGFRVETYSTPQKDWQFASLDLVVYNVSPENLMRIVMLRSLDTMH